MALREQKITVGSLVQWSGAKTYGVVTDIDDRMVYVRWDTPDPPPQFAIGDPPLSRVDLTGEQVRLVSTGENAAILDSIPSDTPAWRCFVATGGGRTVNIPEADLRPLAVTDPVGRFKANLIGPLRQYRLQEVARWYRILHLYDELVSLGQIGADIKPHQVSVVHKVVSNYPHRFLLCDEVGLGKTIEAGMVLKELRARGAAQRVLAIVPPNLVGQWQFEMKTKFNESFSVLNTDTVRFLQNQEQSDNPFTFSDSILCSASWVANPTWAELCSRVNWDLVIVDEAHHARSRRSGNRVTTTRLYQLVSKLAEPDRFAQRGMLFLTATPMQLDTHELYSLVELLDPALFPSEDHFDRHRREVPGLSRLVERLGRNGFPLPDEEPGETIQQVADWLGLEVDVARQRLSSGPEECERLTAELADHHLLSEVLIRNRKAMVGDFMPRIASRWEVELTPEESEALEAVEDYVQYGFQLAEGTNDAPTGFVMVTFQKLMASSIAAIRKSLGRRQERILARNPRASRTGYDLEERLLNDEEASDIVGGVGAASDLVDVELSLLESAIESLDRVKSDSKAEVLVKQLSILFEDSPNEKVLIFTQFRETLRHLEEMLLERGWGVNVFHGQMKVVEKDGAVESFRNAVGPQVLICTEAGGEGRNFQFCHILVNYDLPWNPMRVEQRIGRIDRIGQGHTVSIFNLWVRDTIEERVLDVLENRIRVFEETVGGLDPILGDTESDIRKIMRIAGERRIEALEEFGKQLEEHVLRARDAEAKLGDFIMDTKSYRRELAERIAGQPSPIKNYDLDTFIGQLLSDEHTYIRRTGATYELTFHGEILGAHKDLFVAGNKRRAVFRADRRPDSEDVEFMAFGHPIVDGVVERVLAEQYEGVTGTRRVPASEELAPCAGWLFTYQFNVPGVRTTEHLEPVFVSDEGEVDPEIGHKLVKRAFHFDDDEREIDVSEIPDNLDGLEPLASRVAELKRVDLQKQAEDQAAARVGREVTRLGEWFDYRERVARDKVNATQAILESIRESGDESQRQILPAWEANLRRDEELLDNLAPERNRRIADVQKHRYPQVSWALKSLGRIEVVDSEPMDGPDADLELRAEFAAELRSSLESMERGGAAHSAEEVAQRLGLSW
ncbi:MAG: helicase-related protein [Chloroflexota bacterium]|nr:helicase-related protein [Chloroflexota bacterium]